MINTNISKDIDVDFEISEDFELKLADEVHLNRNYNELLNLPKLDGRLIIGDIPELDPTVPAWAKTATKPEYKAEEVGAIPEGSIRVLGDGDFWEMVENM